MVHDYELKIDRSSARTDISPSLLGATGVQSTIGGRSHNSATSQSAVGKGAFNELGGSRRTRFDSTLKRRRMPAAQNISRNILRAVPANLTHDARPDSIFTSGCAGFPSSSRAGVMSYVASTSAITAYSVWSATCLPGQFLRNTP